MNKITLKKSLMYNKDGKNFIDRTPPATRSITTCLMYNAK